jgi:hypothetical protein
MLRSPYGGLRLSGINTSPPHPVALRTCGLISTINVGIDVPRHRDAVAANERKRERMPPSIEWLHDLTEAQTQVLSQRKPILIYLTKDE